MASLCWRIAIACRMCERPRAAAWKTLLCRGDVKFRRQNNAVKNAALEHVAHLLPCSFSTRAPQHLSTT
eukprot:10194622-Alexandrium_andersonii.AAC.1